MVPISMCTQDGGCLVGGGGEYLRVLQYQEGRVSMWPGLMAGWLASLARASFNGSNIFGVHMCCAEHHHRHRGQKEKDAI